MDEKFLRQALELAKRGVALASPNPHVGAVIVTKDNTIVGVGSHTYDGVAHAEVLALREAGEKARGATLYVNLEPCCHHGRTGPCVEAIIAAGISRVVASMEDPNPQVSGQGFEGLRAARIQVSCGILEEDAKALNEGFANYIRRGIPLCTLKAAMTLDGKIAPSPMKSKNRGEQRATAAPPNWITGAASRAHVQEMRHQSDAIMVGVGTVIADDPLLTDRTGKPRRRRLMRVILDSRLRLPLESRIVQTAEQDVLVLCSFAEEKKKRQLVKRGVQVEQIPEPTAEGHPALPAVMRHLGQMQITSLMIEGGAMVNWAALASGIVDKVYLYYAPKILGGASSVPFAAGPGFAHLGDAPCVRSIRVHRFDEDVAVEGYLRDPYGE
jgi:diaminohydroxyphosphoribosylaminopyrimidine deaminase / 5-amino-6-(5-phosphoribosylamino)uracil reductase